MSSAHAEDVPALEQFDSHNCYVVLGVDEGASGADIKVCRSCHVSGGLLTDSVLIGRTKSGISGCSVKTLYRRLHSTVRL